MNFCDECETCAHCLKQGCIPAAQPKAQARMASKTFNLTFHTMEETPSKHCDVLLYNQCDGYHHVYARFYDGEFAGFYEWMGTTPHDIANFAAWAELPDCNSDLYPTFADPRPFGERS
jgi:hypothetical protein